MKKFEITEITEIEKIIKESQVCNVSMNNNGEPYVIPMNFGYKDGIIYFHSAPNGKKIDLLKNDPSVCVSFYIGADLNVRHENVACSYSMKFKSVLAHGKIEFVEDIDKKKQMMNIIMKHYSGRDDFEYSNPAINNVCIFFLEPKTITAYNRGY